jgi:hypothetical protein
VGFSSIVIDVISNLTLLTGGAVMIGKPCTAIQHLLAVICVIALAMMMHVVLNFGGIDGPSLARADAVYEQRVALPGVLR